MNNDNTTGFNWEKLLNRLKNQNVIPVIGEGLYTVRTRDRRERSLYSFLAEELAGEAGFELTPGMKHPFARAAFAFLNLRKREVYDLQKFLQKRIDAVELTSVGALRKLAGIKFFDLFINTVYDDFLVRELEEVRPGRVGVFHYSRRNRSVLDGLNEALKASSNSPRSLVLNLYGNLRKLPEESAYTEADILETIVSFQEDINRHQQKASPIYEVLSRKALLFIGCGYDDWLFRFFIRSISTHPFERREDIPMKFIGDNSIAEKKGPFVELHGFLEHFDTEIYYAGGGPDFIDALFTRVGTECPKNVIKEEDYPAEAFISFHGADREAAFRLADALREDGIRVWVDKREFGPGDPIDVTIINAIVRCPVFIPLLSRNSRELVTGEGQKYHYREWEWVVQFNLTKDNTPKQIMPVSIDRTDWKDAAFKGVSSMFTQAYCIDIPGGSGGEYDKLRDKLRSVRDSIPRGGKADER